MQDRTPADLARVIGGWSLLALTVNSVVGAGVVGLPGRVFALAGPQTGWVLAAAALLAAMAALCLADLGGRFEGTGGPALYLGCAFGPGSGFVAGWLSWSATVLGAASLLALFADLLGAQKGAPRLAALVLTGLGLTGLTMAGARRSTTAGSALVVVKLLLLGAVAAAGLLAPATPALADPARPHPAAALMLVFFAFVGFERPTAVAGEVENPRLSVPFALVGAMLAVALLYAAVFVACLRGVPDLATSGRPLEELAARTMGPGAVRAFQIGQAVIVLGTLASQWITAPRLLFALAQDGRLPRRLARLDPRRCTPDSAIALTGLVATGLALAGGFAGAAAASSASRLLIFVGCAAALLRLRRQPDAPASRFALPGAAWIARGTVLACLALLASAPALVVQLAGWVLIGGLLWLMTARAARRRSRT